MSSIEQVVNALKVISKHGDLLAEACLDNGGYIGTENEQVAEELRRHRLCIEIDEHSENAVVIQPLKQLIERIGVGRQLMMRSGYIYELRRDMVTHIEWYRAQKGKLDEEKLLRDVDAYVVALIYAIREMSRMFSNDIYDRFRSVHSLEQRIRENRRALDEADRLRVVLDSLSLTYLQEMAGADYHLQGLLEVRLLSEVKRCQTETTQAVEKLREYLARLQEDHRELRMHNRLIDGFLQHYANHPSYQPTSLVTAPTRLLGVQPLEMAAHPPTGEEELESELDELCQEILRRDASQRSRDRTSKREALTRKVEVEDAIGEEVVSELDPLEDIPRQFFESVEDLVQDGPLSVMSKHAVVKDVIEKEIWLIAILSYYRQMPEEDKRCFTIEYVTDPYPNYDGTVILRDLIIKRREDVQAAA